MIRLHWSLLLNPEIAKNTPNRNARIAWGNSFARNDPDTMLSTRINVAATIADDRKTNDSVFRFLIRSDPERFCHIARPSKPNGKIIARHNDGAIAGPNRSIKVPNETAPNINDTYNCNIRPDSCRVWKA